MKLAKLFSRSRFDDRAHDLYDTIVAQSRLPVFYDPGGVPDTLDGRFEITAAGRTTTLGPGDLIHLGTRTPHAVVAVEPGRLLLTMLDPRQS